jgi:hypothetical protein
MLTLKKIFLNSSKAVLFSGLFIFICSSCSEEKKILELANPEAFAYYLNDGWELISTARVRGITQKEIDDLYHLNLEYNVHIVTPSLDTLRNLDYDIITEYNEEEIDDREVEAQIYFSSEFKTGDYIIIFDVKDVYSNQVATISKQFNLSTE